MSAHASVGTTASSINDTSDGYGVYNSQTTAATFIETSTAGLNCGHECPRHFVKTVTLSFSSLTPEQREKIKIEYYKTYDVMTGLKTAASLGGTILLFSLFILYKMKCRHRHGKRNATTIIQTSGERSSDPDVEKDGSGFLNGTPAALLGDGKLPNILAINNVGAGSRRSSRVMASPPEDFQIFSRYESRLSCVTAASSHRPGSRMSCGTILPIHNPVSITGDMLPTSNLSIATASPRIVSPLSPLSRSLAPRFVARDDDTDHTFSLLRPDLACCTEPINIQIIQPTPNVSPCGSIRRLSEDVGALMDGRHSCRDRAPVLIPLLTLPKPHHSKIKCKSKKLHSAEGPAPSDHPSALESSDDGGDLTCLDALNASAVATSRNQENPASDDRHHSTLDLKFIDCSDSDAISLSSDSEALGGLESDIGSPPSPGAASGDFILDFVLVSQATEMVQVDSPLDASESNQINDDSNVSETRC